MKKLLSIVLVTILCVCCAAFCACGLLEEDVEKLAKRCDVEKTLTANAAADISVEIESDVYRIFVYETELNVMSVKYVENPKTTVEVSVKTVVDGTGENSDIKIVEKTNGEFIFAEAKNAFVLVEIPETWTNCDLKVTADVGYVSVDDRHFNSIDITTETGSVDVDADAKSLTIQTDTGSIFVEGNFVNEVVLSANTGSISADVDTQKLVADVNTGSVKFETNATVIDVETNTGSVRGVVEGIKTQYTISVRTSTGSSNVSNQNGDGTHRLEVETDTGSINIKFDK